MGNEGVNEIAESLVGKSLSKSNIENSNDSPAVRARRKARANYEQGKSYSMFSGVSGKVVNDRTIFSQERFDRAYGLLRAQGIVGRDGETDSTGFKESNRQAHADARLRSQENRDRVDSAIERQSQGEVVDTAEPEDANWAEAQETTPLNSTGRARPVGMESVNQEYARRRGVQIARVS